MVDTFYFAIHGGPDFSSMNVYNQGTLNSMGGFQYYAPGHESNPLTNGDGVIRFGKVGDGSAWLDYTFQSHYGASGPG